jgi:choline dehydrogenase-like flavoprotein
LAARLSIGLPEMQVLLLEAGPAARDDLRINVPGLRGSLLKSALDWNFTSTAQNGLDGRIIDVNRGKVLGGSSAMNYAMISLRLPKMMPGANLVARGGHGIL